MLRKNELAKIVLQPIKHVSVRQQKNLYLSFRFAGFQSNRAYKYIKIKVH